MYSLVLSILAAGFLCFFGTLVGYGSIAMLVASLLHGDKTVKLWTVFLFVPISLTFLAAGFASFVYCVQHLRGKPPINYAKHFGVLFIRLK